MRPTGTGRFVLALVVSYAIYDLSFSRALAVAHAVLGGWGLVAALVLLGVAIALLYTAIYDGPLALGRLLRLDRRRQARLRQAP